MPAILYCYSNMGRHYIHELYLTPSDSEGLNLMNIMLVVYGYSSSRICGGSRGSDHCLCLTRSDVTGSHVTFPPYFILRSSAKKCWLGCSLSRPRPITIGNYPPFIFIFYSVYVLQGCLRPITFYEITLIIICPFYFQYYISIMVFGYVV